MKIYGSFLTNLRFVDDKLLCTETTKDLQHMLQEQSDERRRMGLKMNIAKTSVKVELTSVHLLCVASYDIWCSHKDTDQTRTGQHCGLTYQNGKKYAQHHMQVY